MTRIPSGVPTLRPEQRRQEADTFIGAAPGKTALPWQAPHVRDDLRVQLNTDQPERLMLKLDWIAYQTKTSKRAIIERALNEFVAKELARIGMPDS